MTNLFQGFLTDNAKRRRKKVVVVVVVITTKYQLSSNRYCVIPCRYSVNSICLMSLQSGCSKGLRFLGSRGGKSILYRMGHCRGTQELLKEVRISMKITKFLLRLE